MVEWVSSAWTLHGSTEPDRRPGTICGSSRRRGSCASVAGTSLVGRDGRVDRDWSEGDRRGRGPKAAGHRLPPDRGRDKAPAPTDGAALSLPLNRSLIGPSWSAAVNAKQNGKWGTIVDNLAASKSFNCYDPIITRKSLAGEYKGPEI
ncbi:hypothetical protein GWI33_003838 [Rhynchophorus ferrugineus]|uniref:Uncharacterized protein n=1 Tax=Rhynchophorus ferrugineus TaxID=354439 RepID=A0A834HKF7_RHYFE|nr:hypothetical protein GWI33_003841 [Rhynchophorus ferrugineus]KAF7262929.1 hypothetical protein GWI33_003838 [Rhynchophorus ferrugineus]